MALYDHIQKLDLWMSFSFWASFALLSPEEQVRTNNWHEPHTGADFIKMHQSVLSIGCVV